MNENFVKEVKVIDNTQWKERHQFVLSANDNIICQRYFKVNGFNSSALRSYELYETVRDVVEMIKKDLTAKSRIYTSIMMNKRSKLTGFYFNDDITAEDCEIICDDRIEGCVQLSNGVIIDKSYIDYSDVEEDEDDTPFTFKFSYIFDDKVIYEEIWDGSVYPKYVRNSVDLSNSSSFYRNTDPMRMSFSQQMSKHLTEGRNDLIYAIIKMLSTTLSKTIDEEGNAVEKDYTMDMEYGDKTYDCSPYPREIVRGWANAVRRKTINYRKWVDGNSQVTSGK